MIGGKALASDADAFSAASLENYVALNKQMRSENERHAQNAQRHLRARWLGCGPESWCPEECECDPCGEGEDDVGGNTFINTTFTGDKAVAQLASLLKEEEQPQPPPQPPPVQPPVTPSPDKWLLRLLALLLGLGLLIAGLLLLANYLFNGDAGNELIAIPYQP